MRSTTSIAPEMAAQIFEPVPQVTDRGGATGIGEVRESLDTHTKGGEAYSAKV
jgi:hypothetical protein